MPHLRIALGYPTQHRSVADAVVLACGTDKGALQAAVNAAPADLVRFEFGIFTSTGKATRSVATLAVTEEPRTGDTELTGASAAILASPSALEEHSADLKAAQALLAEAGSKNSSAIEPVPPATVGATHPPEAAAPTISEGGTSAQVGGDQVLDDAPSILPPSDSPTAPRTSRARR